MSADQHTYAVRVEWTGNRGVGTRSYREYGREHAIRAAGKAEIAGSSDPAYRGNPERWNPEELLVASASACHKLWYLHLCADAGIVVTAYVDDAAGVIADAASGGGFARIVLRPRVTLAPGGDAARAAQLHEAAHARCNIANSLRCPIRCEPAIVTAASPTAPD
jgi:organic hydroperoxide reductase OsmC/OhrA